MNTVLLIEDEPSLRTLLAQILTLEGFAVTTAETLHDAKEKLAADVQVVLADMNLPDGNGLDMIPLIKEKSPPAEIVIMTAFGNVESGVKAMKLGAFDFIVKGDDDERIVLTVERALEKSRLRREVKALQARVESKTAFSKLIGKSKEISDAIELAKKVAPTDTPVLLLGETGTGKELFAEAIHQASRRSGTGFLAVNCSAIPKDLQESELFGYKRGAFTGATTDKKGFFEEANGGTIFLDELGDMHLETQAKLLRVLETKTFFRVGEAAPRPVDVRVIAATHHQLEEDVRRGAFREDLFYRLNGFTIDLPALRERTEDIDLLAMHYLALYSEKLGQKISGMTPEFKLALKRYAWRGNIRELKNVIERAVILSSDEFLSVELLPEKIAKPNADAVNPVDTDVHQTLAEVEKHHIADVLRALNGNKVQTAKRLDIGAATLYRKLKEYGLDK
jgi:two-component system, NtrC family, response regulator